MTEPIITKLSYNNDYVLKKWKVKKGFEMSVKINPIMSSKFNLRTGFIKGKIQFLML